MVPICTPEVQEGLYLEISGEQGERQETCAVFLDGRIHQIAVLVAPQGNPVLPEDPQALREVLRGLQHDDLFEDSGEAVGKKLFPDCLVAHELRVVGRAVPIEIFGGQQLATIWKPQEVPEDLQVTLLDRQVDRGEPIGGPDVQFSPRLDRAWVASRRL